MMKLPKRMWAGIMEDRVYTVPIFGVDDYAPIAIAMFSSEVEARKRFERVVEIDPAAWLAQPANQK